MVHFLLWQAAKPSGDKCTPYNCTNSLIGAAETAAPPMNETAAPHMGICVFYVRTITNKIQFAKKIYHIYQQQHNLLAFSKTKAGRFPIFQLSYQDIYQPICQFSIENTHNRRFII